MYYLLLLISALFPIFLYGTYIYKKDINKESTSLLIKLFLGGIIAVFVVLGFSALTKLSLNNIIEDKITLSLIMYVFLGIGLVEELSKWLFVYLIAYNDKEFDETYDAIIYASFVALGFACFENILYVFNGGLNIALIRMVSAIPLHVFSGILMGCFLSLAKQTKKPYLMLILSVLIPTFVHGIYDLLCLIKINGHFILLYIFIIISFIITILITSYCAKDNHPLT